MHLLNIARPAATDGGGAPGDPSPSDNHGRSERAYGRLALLVLLIAAVLALLMLTGCGESETITVQQVYNLDRARARPVPMRILAAVVPYENQAWFFKVAGSDSRVSSAVDAFEQLLGSVRFEDGTPTWDTPQGWIEVPSEVRQLRFATYKIGEGDQAPEFTVIPLPTQGPVDTEYVLANVNRWRNQLNLPSLTPGELASNSTTLDVGGQVGTLVNMAGRSTYEKLNARPFASGMARPQMPAAEPSVTPPAEQGGGGQIKLVYKTPEGWQPGQLNAFRKAAFDIVDGDRSALVTVIELGPEARDPMSNINRWRGEIGLGPTTPQEVEPDLQRIEIGGSTGILIEMVGPESPDQQTILAAFAAVEGRPWFFKFKGNSSLATEQKEKFLAFLKSVQFEKQ